MNLNTDLRRNVVDELEWEPSIDAADIGVTAHDGIVTLTGFAPSYAEKLKAEQVVKRVHGVKAVANDIEVRLSGHSERTDSDIARAAVDALRWKSSVPGEEIKVSVSKGWITLEGDVHWQFQKSGAYEAVHHLVGVRGVTNLITVKPRASATEVKSRIEAAFRRSAEVDAQKVQVETHDGRVMLRGDVRSWSERQEAERTAWAAPGVRQVENLIRINP
jgi:osmotically-inducible protein OsmY